MRKEILFVGEGGQGIILIGEIFAETAHSVGKEVACSSTYGAAVRGGVCTSEAVISDEPIDFPGVMAPDILVAMSQEGYDAAISKISPDSTVFFDTDTVLVIRQREVKQVSIPAAKIASELGSRMAANMVMLGSVVAVTELVSLESLCEIVKKKSGKFAENNLGAITEGHKLGKQHLMNINQKGDK